MTRTEKSIVVFWSIWLALVLIGSAHSMQVGDGQRVAVVAPGPNRAELRRLLLNNCFIISWNPVKGICPDPSP